MPTFVIWAISGRESTVVGTVMLAWIMTYAQSETIMQYASVDRSMLTAASCAFWRCRTGCVGYTCAKKKSMQLSTRAGETKPWVREKVEESVRPSKPKSAGKPAASCAFRWFSRSSDRTFARLPLGPFF